MEPASLPITDLEYEIRNHERPFLVSGAPLGTVDLIDMSKTVESEGLREYFSLCRELRKRRKG